jgi:phosphoglycerate dehydrogenase-like enzyme
MNKSRVEVLITINFSEAQINDLRTVSPRLVISSFPVNSIQEIPADAWKRTEVLYTANIIPEPKQVPNLKWIQSHFAGIDALLQSEIAKTGQAVLTSL